MKTLREELRKVQSSAALLERQRNPGVGYWTTRKSESSESHTSISTPTPDTPLRESSPTPSTATSNQNEEEINLEYLRNVILQFLEHKEMRVRFRSLSFKPTSSSYNPYTSPIWSKCYPSSYTSHLKRHAD